MIDKEFSFLSSGLRELPSLVPGSSLKKLEAYKCDIQLLPADLFRYCLEEVDLHENKGELRVYARGHKKRKEAREMAGMI